MEEEMKKELLERLERIERWALIGAKEMLTVDECALYVGCSRVTLYRKTSTHAIPYYKPTGGTIYFKKSEIDLWLQKNRRKTTEEIESEAVTRCTLSRMEGRRRSPKRAAKA